LILGNTRWTSRSDFSIVCNSNRYVPIDHDL
jgi:hypothetical protein